MTIVLDEEEAAGLGLTGLSSDDPLKAKFMELWAEYAPDDLPTPTTEYRFAAQVLKRQWRSDIAWPSLRVALEFEGGIWSQARGRRCPTCGLPPKGSHGRGWGILRDMEKGLAYTALNWLVMRVPSHSFRQDVDVQHLVVAQAIGLVGGRCVTAAAWTILQAQIEEFQATPRGREELIRPLLDALSHLQLGSIDERPELWAEQPWAIKSAKGKR